MDPGNNCWCHEVIYPDGSNELSNSDLVHIHVKDMLVETPKMTLHGKKREKISWPIFSQTNFGIDQLVILNVLLQLASFLLLSVC